MEDVPLHFQMTVTGQVQLKVVVVVFLMNINFNVIDVPRENKKRETE